jgi:hypothetical protein
MLGRNTSEADWRRDAAVGRKRSRAAMDALADTLVVTGAHPVHAVGCGDGAAPAAEQAAVLDEAGEHMAASGQDAAPDAARPAEQQQPQQAADPSAALKAANTNEHATSTGMPASEAPPEAQPPPCEPRCVGTEAADEERRRHVECLLHQAHPGSPAAARRAVVGAGVRFSTGKLSSTDASAIAQRLNEAAAEFPKRKEPAYQVQVWPWLHCRGAARASMNAWCRDTIVTASNMRHC